MNETNEGDLSQNIKIKGKRKSILIKDNKRKSIMINDKRKSVLIKNDKDENRKTVTIKEEQKEDSTTTKINIKSRRKSMMNKKILMNLEDNKLDKEPTNSSSKRNSIFANSISKIRLNLNEDKEIHNTNNKPSRRRKSAFIRPIFELNNFTTLKAKLVDISEIVVQQESDIVEAVLGCQQPNNYHIYGRQPDGELTYLYKLREFSSCIMRICCPVNCRGFTMKMKLVSSYENKYDKDFTNHLMILEKNLKIPFLCLIRPEITIKVVEDNIYLGMIEKSFTCCDPSFAVYNENNEIVKQIETECCQCGFICRNNSLGKTDDVHFYIYNPNDRSKPIGDICKKTESVFSIADSYSVIYPVKIPPEEKILLSIVAVMIDYQYFEKNNVK